jgi:hypothetical protein
MERVWIKGCNGNVNRSQSYKSERVMVAALKRLLRNRAAGPMSEIYVYTDWSPYSGPNEDSCIGRVAFQGDGFSPGWFPRAN